MGISDGADLGAPDGVAGTLVWVRRRNGSWWPGRILSADEVPDASPLMSPKTGTPVKLLGREDASVEWYNLEKSIRVKAFRCGEFDDCIERAEASEGSHIKRREKYARREDAILHALELERKQTEMKYHKAGVSANNISSNVSCVIKREFNNFSNNYAKKNNPAGCKQFSDPKSQLLSRRSLSSLEEDNVGDPLYMHKGKIDKSFIKEEDDHESIPRTRGLQDFGLRSAPPKKKHYQFVAWDSLQKPIDNHADASSAEQNIGGARHTGSVKKSLPLKRKSSHGGIPEESPAKRRDRRRPLLQVLESSKKLPPFHSFQTDPAIGVTTMQGEIDHMGAICRAKRSRCIYLPADSNDSVDHVGYSLKLTPTTQARVDSSQHNRGSLTDENTSSGFEEIDSDSSERECSENIKEGEDILHRGSKYSGRDGRYNPIEPHMHHHGHTVDAAAEVGVSKWHMKGKRNIRSLAKSPTGMMDGTIFNNADRFNGSVEETSYESKGIGFKMRRTDHSSQMILGDDFYPKKELSTCDEGDLVNNDANYTQLIGLDNQTYPLALKAAKACSSNFIDSDDDSLQANWKDDRPSHVDRTYWKEPECSASIYADHHSDEIEAILVDVDLKVRASYQGEHVPLVSLMSRLNGKAIIGHPVQVEILEDGSSGRVVSRNEPSLDESTVPSPVWKTARRTVIQRVPRSNPAPSTLEGEETEPLRNSNVESIPPLKKAYTSHFSHQARLAKKSISHAHRSASGKFQRRLVKSVSLSGQKIRRLSSLSTEQKRSSENGDAKPNHVGGILGGLIKPDGTVPLVTCVPFKVVFSRILESVDRPPSSATHRVLVTGSITKDP